jgi:galactokinase
VERGFGILAAPRADGVIQIIDAVSMESSEFLLSRSTVRREGHWSNYFGTVARRIANNFPSAGHGATIAFSSNLPPSAGMSSSSALVVGAFLLIAAVNKLFENDLPAAGVDNREKLAGYLGTVENGSSFGPLLGDRGVGTFGGSEDHTAILCGVSDGLVQYSYCPVRFRRAIPLSDRFVFAIASSGVIAEKTGAARDQYNRLSLLVKTIVQLWQQSTNGTESSLAEILAADESTRQLRQILVSANNSRFSNQQLLDRLEHFEFEDRLIRSLPVTIDESTLDQFGQIVKESQHAAERLLANQTPETVHLSQSATQLGAHAASAFGAGFGGSVWALIDAVDESSFLQRWRGAYAKEFPPRISQSTFFATRPAPPAQLWSGEAWSERFALQTNQ